MKPNRALAHDTAEAGLPASRLRASALVAALILGFCANTSAAEEAAKSPAEPSSASGPAEKKNEPESRVKKGPNGETILTLDAATRNTMGLQTARLAPAQLSPELKAYGRVLDASALALLVAEFATAQAANQASQAELKRLQTLAAQNNASDRSLQAAEAAAARDKAQVGAIRLRLLANWGGAIANRKDLPAFAQSLVALERALVELDVPAGQALSAMPTSARLQTLGEQDAPLTAQFIGPAAAVDPQLQGRGFLFLVSPNRSRLAPGAAVSGFLTLPGEPQSGVTLPRDAVVRFNARTWAYRQTGEGTFARIEVNLDSPLSAGWFVREGLKPQDQVVTVGSQQMLSEELKGQAGE